MGEHAEDLKDRMMDEGYFPEEPNLPVEKEWVGKIGDFKGEFVKPNEWQKREPYIPKSPKTVPPQGQSEVPGWLSGQAYNLASEAVLANKRFPDEPGFFELLNKWADLYVEDLKKRNKIN